MDTRIPSKHHLTIVDDGLQSANFDNLLLILMIYSVACYDNIISIGSMTASVNVTFSL